MLGVLSENTRKDFPGFNTHLYFNEVYKKSNDNISTNFFFFFAEKNTRNTVLYTERDKIKKKKKKESEK